MSLIRPKTSPRLPLTADDEAHNATLDACMATLAQERQARAVRRAERQLAAIKRAEAKAAKKKAAAAKKAAKLPRPYSGKVKSVGARGAGGRAKRGGRQTIRVPLPHHVEGRT